MRRNEHIIKRRCNNVSVWMSLSPVFCYTRININGNHTYLFHYWCLEYFNKVVGIYQRKNESNSVPLVAHVSPYIYCSLYLRIIFWTIIFVICISPLAIHIFSICKMYYWLAKISQNWLICCHFVSILHMVKCGRYMNIWYSPDI